MNIIINETLEITTHSEDICCCSVTQLYVTPWTVAHQGTGDAPQEGFFGPQEHAWEVNGAEWKCQGVNILGNIGG